MAISDEHLVRLSDEMPIAHHVFHITGILDLFLRVPCAVAPRDDGAWIVLKRVTETADALFRWQALFGTSESRKRYNSERCARARKSGRTELGSFLGFSDYFLPVPDARQSGAVLVAGPFAPRPLRVLDIQHQWRDFSGAIPDVHDPHLAAYARVALDVPLFAPNELAAFAELLELLAAVVAGRPPTPAEVDRVSELRLTVFGRMAYSRQLKALEMLQSQGNHEWTEQSQLDAKMQEIGVTHIPNTVVALMPSAETKRGDSACAQLVAARDFQRRAAELCPELTNTLSAPLEDYGAYVLFHVSERRSAARARLEIAERARRIADRLARDGDCDVTVGIGGIVENTSDLPHCARAARLALERAVHQRATVGVAVPSAPDQRPLRADETPAALLSEVVKAFSTGLFAELEAHAAQYVDAVLLESAGRPSRLRVHFEYAVDTLVASPWARGATDLRTSSDLRRRLNADLSAAESGPALVEAFRAALRVLVGIARRPAESHGELKIAMAVHYMEDHCNRPLTLEGVARHVGLSKTYFCRCFKAACGEGFSDHLRAVRVERAKRLLRNSPLSIQRVCQESGFVSVPHFNRSFKKAVGLTPSQFRLSGALSRPSDVERDGE